MDAVTRGLGDGNRHLADGTYDENHIEYTLHIHSSACDRWLPATAFDTSYPANCLGANITSTKPIGRFKQGNAQIHS